MKCPYCRADNDRVVDSRASQDGFAVRRRRLCSSCGRRYTTYERVEEAVLKVVKKDKSRVPYDRNRIKSGIEKACWKRPISPDQIDRILARIEDDLYANFESEVPSEHIGELVMQELSELDQVAYVRFASIYREFKDVQDFLREVEPMLDATKRLRS
ncbi:Transcriptional repressor NrdR [Planctomycetales bacterium 10988]|nr:Transcriptional repressor NrdR [Planctomycetales bacterium 10988]